MKRLDDDELRALLNQIKGVFYLDEHFVYAGFEHGKKYANLRKLLGRTSVLRILCGELAHRIYDAIHADLDDTPLVVVGAETMGRDMAVIIAMILEDLLKCEINYVFISSDDLPGGKKRYYLNEKSDFEEFLRGSQTIFVDDLVNAGSTGIDCVELLRGMDSIVLAACAIINRGGLTAKELNTPYFVPLLDLVMEKHTEADCPLCKDRIPVVSDLGRGKVWSENNPDFPTKTVL